MTAQSDWYYAQELEPSWFGSAHIQAEDDGPVVVIWHPQPDKAAFDYWVWRAQRALAGARFRVGFNGPDGYVDAGGFVPS